MSRFRDDSDDYDDPPPKRYIRCSDRMCGAEDCPTCHPENFRGGVYFEDLEGREKEEFNE